jgi:hypothetical protein
MVTSSEQLYYLDSPPPLTSEEAALYAELLAQAQTLELELARFEFEHLMRDEYYHSCGNW